MMYLFRRMDSDDDRILVFAKSDGDAVGEFEREAEVRVLAHDQSFKRVVTTHGDYIYTSDQKTVRRNLKYLTE